MSRESLRDVLVDLEVDPRLRKGCRDKLVYETRKRAKRGARHQRVYGHAKLHVYKCTFCGGFHLTHNNRGTGG